MASQRFLGGFVAIFSDEQVSFAESESSPPLWLIDTNLFAGQPLLSVGTTPKFRESTTTIVLSGALYPGTNLPADLSIEITESR